MNLPGQKLGFGIAGGIRAGTNLQGQTEHPGQALWRAPGAGSAAQLLLSLSSAWGWIEMLGVWLCSPALCFASAVHSATALVPDLSYNSFPHWLASLLASSDTESSADGKRFRDSQQDHHEIMNLKLEFFRKVN